MLQLLPGFALFIYCTFSFCREVKLDRKRFLEKDRLGDEHILREIEKHFEEQRIAQGKQIPD